MALDGKIRELAERLGADFWGVADLSIAHEAILEQGGPAIGAFPRAVSVGVALLDPLVDALPRRAERAVARLWYAPCSRGRGVVFANGGDPLDSSDTAWMLAATALVLLMTPALAFFYGGLVRSKNALNAMMMSVVALGFVGIAWALIGYSLAFAPGARWWAISLMR